MIAYSYSIGRLWLLLLLFSCLQVFVLPLFLVAFDNSFRVTNSVDNKLHGGDAIVSILVLENPSSKTLVFVKRDNNRQKLRLKLSKGKRKRSVDNHEDLPTLNESTTRGGKVLLKNNQSSRIQRMQQLNCSSSSSTSMSKHSNERKIKLRNQKKSRNISSEINRYLKLKYKRLALSNSRGPSYLNGSNSRKLYLHKYRHEQHAANLPLSTTKKLNLRRNAAKRIQGAKEISKVQKKLLLRQKTMQHHYHQVRFQSVSSSSLNSLSTLPLSNTLLPVSTVKGTKLLLKNKKQRRDAIRPAKLLLRQYRGKNDDVAAKRKKNHSQKSNRKLKFRKSNTRGKKETFSPLQLPSQSVPSSPGDDPATSDTSGSSISAIIFAAVAILLGTLLHPMLRTTPTLAVDDEAIPAILSYSRDSERKKKVAGTPQNITASPFLQEDDGMAALSIAQREHAQYSIDDEPQLWQNVSSPFKSAFSFGQVCTPTPAKSAPPNTKASTASRMVTRAMSAAFAASNHVDGLSPARRLF